MKRDKGGDDKSHSTKDHCFVWSTNTYNSIYVSTFCRGDSQ